MTHEIVILGAGGHARVVLSLLRACGLTASGCVAPRQPDAPCPVDVPWLGSDEALTRLDPARVHLVNGIGSVGNTGLRQTIYEAGRARGFTFVTIRHPTAVIDAEVALGNGTQVMAGAILQTGVRTGANVIVNTGAIIDHDGAIGDHAHLAPGARLSGGVSVGLGAHVGTGAVVIQGVVIGAGATVGAGAVVLADVAPGEAVAGVPARPITRRNVG